MPVSHVDDSWRPALFAAAEYEIRLLARQDGVTSIHDTVEDQLEELVLARRSGLTPTKAELEEDKAGLTGGRPLAEYGTWVFYPWSGRVVHVLPRSEFRELRTDRNRDKITRAEQHALLGRRLGVIGLSVGGSAAMTCAMEGVGALFRLADFDRLGASNLNRLSAGVHDLGVEKSVLLARRMYEFDPYLEIELYRDGLTEETVEEFVNGLDLLVEECDTPWVKIAARQHARQLGVPVVMDCNDRGMLDVERFDLDARRPLLHGRIHDVAPATVRSAGRTELVELLVHMVDRDRMSPALADAIDELGKTLSSWPQLASGVSLGAALVTDAARRILLGEKVPSGRYYVDLAELVAAESPVGGLW
ncbi:ThiF family adenylyltransferase [Kribbella sp. NPDC056861]|uniref:ThiF family adenylyltransferase n=1 Tax=Kribbella sp. NPDC056861 TaxID=3154857 RepID=UPI003445249B